MNTTNGPRHFSLVAALLMLGLAACNKPQDPAAAPAAQSAPPADQSTPGAQSTPPAQSAPLADQAVPVTNGDPANGNLASADQSGYQPDSLPPAPPAAPSDDQDASYEQPVQASEPPPPLPEYSQPPTPGDDYIWTPGYWSYATAGYYWVPGAWIVAPYVGALWTPSWWGFESGDYHWHSGYWGAHIGYYGGIDYGYGYTGRGYYGAYWNNGRLDYNRAVTNVNASVVHNVYSYKVPNNRGNRVSYNGGRGGIAARPTPQELAVVRDLRMPPVRVQVQHAREASSNRAQFLAPGRTQPAALVASRPIATPYKAPAARPPATAMRTVTPPAQATRIPEKRVPTPQAARPQESRPAVPPRPAPQARPQEAARAPEFVRPQQPKPLVPARPAPQARPQEAARPQESRPAARPQESRPAARPAPQARPQEAARPQESRPAAPPHPAPQARPQEPKPAPLPHPAAKPKEEEHKEH